MRLPTLALALVLTAPAGCTSGGTLDRQEAEARDRTCVSLIERRMATASLDPDAAARLSPRLRDLVEPFREDPDAFYERLSEGLEDPGPDRREAPTSNLREVLDRCAEAVR